MTGAQPLSLLSETEYEHKAPEGFPVSCPTLDLSATWDSTGRNLLIYRPPEQAVSKIHQGSAPGTKPPEPLAVTWKPDGHFLAVGWSDGCVRLMGLENNKAAHNIKISEQADVKITHIGWASATIPSAAFEAGIGVLEQDAPGFDGVARVADLPRELTLLEVDTALPKMSPLPSNSAGTGEDALVFTLRSGIEFLFQPPERADYDKVDAMLVGTSDGNLHLSIYDSFVIGAFQYKAPGASATCNLIHHASHPSLSTQCLVMADQPKDPQEVHIVPLDLPFVSSSPINLSLLASKLTMLQKLLRYVKQTQLHMQVEWNNTRELPSRFLRSVEGDLEDSHAGPRNIVAALYHTVVTGHAYEPVREWLVDSLAERGHKRWDKAVMSGLEALRSLVHENYLPSLDRCAIIFSRLRGLAQFHDTRDDIGFSLAQINRALDIISCLSLVGHKILAHVMDELEHFTAFSVWLRFQIDRFASSSSANDELTEQEATMDNAKVLGYIERYLTKSPLDIYLGQVTKEDNAADWALIEDIPSLLDALDQQLKKEERGGGATGQLSMKALPHVEFLVDYVTTRTNRMFGDIADANRRSVRFGNEMTVNIGRPMSKIDVKMASRGGQSGTIYIAVASDEEKSKVHVFRSTIEVVNGISSSQPLASCCVDLGSRKVIDVKFISDDTLLVACSDADVPAIIIGVPLGDESLPYAPFDAGDPASAAAVVTVEGFPEFALPPELGMRPVRMEAHPRGDVRGEIPPRLCLLGANRTTLRTFEVPLG